MRPVTVQPLSRWPEVATVTHPRAVREFRSSAGAAGDSSTTVKTEGSYGAFDLPHDRGLGLNRQHARSDAAGAVRLRSEPFPPHPAPP